MRRLRTQLLLIVLLAMLPALAFQMYAELEARRVRQRLVRDEALRLAQLVTSEEQRIIGGAEEVLDALAAAPSVQDGIFELCQRLLTNLVRSSPRYTAAAVVGRDGHPVCLSGRFDPTIDLSDRAYFRLALQTGRFAVGDYVIGRGSGRPTIGFAKPFNLANGELGGVVLLSLSADWIGRQLDGLNLPTSSIATIVDRNGTIVARAPDGPRYMGTPMRAENRYLLDGTANGITELISRDGRPMIVANVPGRQGPAGLSVMVGLDRETSFAAVTRANRFGIMLIAAGAVLAFGTTIAFGERLIGRPVNRLLAAAAQWRSGALGARTGLREDGSEFGRLGAAFDGMAAALDERDRSLRESEAVLRRLTGDLETRVQVEVSAREAAQQRAAHAERVQALGQLAGGIAHDFNNIMQTVIGAASLVRAGVDDPAGVRRLAQLVLDAGERGIAVTRRLLAFARRGNLRAETLDVASVLGSLREIFAGTLGSAIALDVRLGEGLGPLRTDKGQLETVLVNLATNARDAMPEGGRLVLSAEPELVARPDPPHPAGLTPGLYVRLTVADTGTGMDAETLARADEPFFTTKPPGVGTGLGLSMARGFADQSGGALRIESALGVGTTVTLWLPEAGPEPGEEAPGPPANSAVAGLPAATPRPGARVLVVDDDDAVREVLELYLAHAGHQVVTAADGSAALALLAQADEPDVLVTDLSMPGMDGLAVIRAAQQRYPRLPAVLLTGYAGDAASLAANGGITGQFALLLKPIRGSALVDQIEALVGVAARVA